MGAMATPTASDTYPGDSSAITTISAPTSHPSLIETKVRQATVITITDGIILRVP
jgi:hypothetical protein